MAGTRKKSSRRKKSTCRPRKKSTTRRSKRGALKYTKGPNKGKYTWLGFLKQFAADRSDLSYGEAMKAAKPEWKQYKKDQGYE